MQLYQRPWAEAVFDCVDERELADLPSGTAPWIVISVGLWIVISVISLMIYLR